MVSAGLVGGTSTKNWVTTPTFFFLYDDRVVVKLSAPKKTTVDVRVYDPLAAREIAQCVSVAEDDRILAMGVYLQDASWGAFCNDCGECMYEGPTEEGEVERRLAEWENRSAVDQLGGLTEERRSSPRV
jgi:hypothetical protein